jgi:hypothetical protein
MEALAVFLNIYFRWGPLSVRFPWFTFPVHFSFTFRCIPEQLLTKHLLTTLQLIKYMSIIYRNEQQNLRGAPQPRQGLTINPNPSIYLETNWYIWGGGVGWCTGRGGGIGVYGADKYDKHEFEGFHEIQSKCSNNWRKRPRKMRKYTRLGSFQVDSQTFSFYGSIQLAPTTPICQRLNKHVNFSWCKLFKMKTVVRVISGSITIPHPSPHATPPSRMGWVAGDSDVSGNHSHNICFHSE